MPRWQVVAVAIALSMAGVGVSTATQFWDETPFDRWTDKQVQKLLTDSPWAHEIAVPLPPGRPRESGPPGGGRGGGDAEGGNFGPAFRVRLIVSWRSALPFKQALVRGQAGPDGTVSKEGQELLERQEAFYIIGLTGLPPQFSSTPLPSIKSQSTLKVEGKPPIAASDVTFQANGRAMVVAFPKTTELKADDREVEFATKIGDLGVKVKFKLKDMIFHGDLTL